MPCFLKIANPRGPQTSYCVWPGKDQSKADELLFVPYQIESYASTFHFYSLPPYSTVTFPLQDIKTTEKYRDAFNTK